MRFFHTLFLIIILMLVSLSATTPLFKTIHGGIAIPDSSTDSINVVLGEISTTPKTVDKITRSVALQISPVITDTTADDTTISWSKGTVTITRKIINDNYISENAVPDTLVKNWDWANGYFKSFTVNPTHPIFGYRYFLKRSDGSTGIVRFDFITLEE